MKKYNPLNISKLLWMLTAISLLCLLFHGCSLKGRNLPESYLDTPEQHALNGFKFISKERVLDAQREFKESVGINPEYSPAYRGLALVYGMRGNFRAAYDSINQAMHFAKTLEDKALAHVAMMRLLLMKREGKWLALVEKHSASALALVKELPDAYFYLGVAYNYAYRFNDSEQALKRVLDINKSLTAEAERQLKLAREIRLAKPGSAFGKKVVFLPRITRADAAGLLVHELRRDLIFAIENPPGKNARGTLGGKRSTGKSASLPPDIIGHPRRTEIEKILQLNIRGLRKFGDGTFEPDEYITRASFASAMADIIGRLDKHTLHALKYDEKVSPFEDVNKNSSYFNDIMICSAYGRLMGGKQALFRPMATVSGAEALLIIRKLEKELSTRN